MRYSQHVSFKNRNNSNTELQLRLGCTQEKGVFLRQIVIFFPSIANSSVSCVCMCVGVNWQSHKGTEVLSTLSLT